MLKNVQKRGGNPPQPSEFSPLQRLNLLQEPLSLQNYIPTSVSDSALPQHRHPPALLPRLGATGCQTWDLVLGCQEGSPGG